MGKATRQSLDVTFDQPGSGPQAGLCQARAPEIDLRFWHHLASKTFLSGCVTFALNPSSLSAHVCPLRSLVAR